ncbi:MAG: hypothetical protein ACETWM_06955 [Candidatus Lokiarchaeia archaeon]
MSAKEVAILYYKLMMENNKEWLKTIRKSIRGQADKYGSSPYFWWDTRIKRVDKQKMSYKFKNEDPRFRTDRKAKFFFHRLDMDGKPSGSGQVPIHLIKDEEDNDEWRVDVSSW